MASPLSGFSAEQKKVIRESLIGTHWIKYEDLQHMTTVSIIDHMLFCQKVGTECLNRKPFHDELPTHPAAKWSAFRNQVMWCLQVLQERGVYEADPYRDDKGDYQNIKDLSGG